MFIRTASQIDDIFTDLGGKLAIVRALLRAGEPVELAGVDSAGYGAEKLIHDALKQAYDRAMEVAQAADRAMVGGMPEAGSATVPRDKQRLALRGEVDGEFAPLSDAVDAASNVLEAFGELTGDPNAQAAIIGPKLRETYEAVYERVLALVSGHDVQTATESHEDMLQHFDELFGALVQLARVSKEMEMDARAAPPMKLEVAWYVDKLRLELTKVLQTGYGRGSGMEVSHAS